MIRGVIDAITNGNFAQKKGVNAFQTSQVITKLGWVGATLVMSVNAAVAAKEVLRRAGVELVLAQRVLTFENFQTGQRHTGGNGAPATTHGAVATAGIHYPIG